MKRSNLKTYLLWATMLMIAITISAASASPFSSNPAVVSSTHYWGDIIGYDASGNEVGRIPDTDGVFGLTIDDNGNIFGIKGGDLLYWTPAGEALGVYATGMYYPIDVCIAPNGNMYATSNGAGNGIYVIQKGWTPGYSVNRFVVTAEALWCIDADPNGNIWVTSSSSNVVKAFTPNGELLNSYVVNAPYGIVADDAGNIYVTSGGTKLMKLAVGGSSFTQLAPTFGAATDLSYDRNGNIIISDYNQYSGAGRPGYWKYEIATGAISGFAPVGVPSAYSAAAKVQSTNTISYQGKLTDASGNPVADGAYSVSFKVYNAPAGGDVLWTSGAINVTTSGGLFSTIMGPIPTITSNGSLWLETAVGTETLSPREKLAATPFSISSQFAHTADVAWSLSGPPASKFYAVFPGGANFFTGSDENGTTTGVYLEPNDGTWYMMSDRNAKKNFAKVNSNEILDKLSRIDIKTWNYNNSDTLHIGPVAQDFYASFGLGANDKSISTVDADGIALAAIQALNKKINDRDKVITELHADIQKMKNQLLKSGKSHK